MENTNEKLYLGTNGKYYQRYEMANAYFLATGRDICDVRRPVDGTKMFDIWIHNLIGLSIAKIVDMNDVSYENFLRANQKILAVRAYRERNDCTLKDAKDAIDKIQEEVEANNA